MSFKEHNQKKPFLERRKSDTMGITSNSSATFMYSSTTRTDGFKSKTFSSGKLHKKVFDSGKNTQTTIQKDLLGKENQQRGKSHKRAESIRNCHESQIVLC